VRVLKLIPDIEFNNLALKVTKILPKLLGIGKFKKQGSISERRDKYIMASNPLSHFIKEHCDKGYGLFMRYSELYMAYRKYLHDNKKRKIGYKEFNDVLALEGFEVSRTTKKIGEMWVNGKFIEGLALMNDMQVMINNPLSPPYRELIEKQNITYTTNTKEELHHVEELITPTHIACKTCKAQQSNFSYNGNYFCSKDCVMAYNTNK